MCDAELMRSIRDVAVFAWAVVGINRNLASYGHGLPGQGAQPLDGLPVWDPTAGLAIYQRPENQVIARSFSAADQYPEPERLAFGYGATSAARRPSVQRYNSAPASSPFQREQHPHTPDIFPQQSGGRVFGTHQVNFAGNEDRCRRDNPPRGSSCDCPARQQIIETATTRVHANDCTSTATTQGHYHNHKDTRRQQH